MKFEDKRNPSSFVKVPSPVIPVIPVSPVEIFFGSYLFARLPTT